MYKIKITAKAKKELKTLSKAHFLAIGNILEDLKSDPHIGKSLKRKLLNRFSYRVGVYRIIYKIDEKDKSVIIITAGHRSFIYQ